LVDWLAHAFVFVSRLYDPTQPDVPPFEFDTVRLPAGGASPVNGAEPLQTQSSDGQRPIFVDEDEQLLTDDGGGVNTALLMALHVSVPFVCMSLFVSCAR
jgi:hypothetical protein